MFLYSKFRASLFIPILLCSQCSQANDYTISSIPDSLKLNAGAVVREEHMVMNIPDQSHVVTSEERVISILDATQENLTFIRIDYNNTEFISDLKACVFDAAGNIIYRLKGQDVLDLSATTYELTTNYRYKLISLKKSNPPYTIQVSFNKESGGTFLLPEWRPVATTGISIEHADLKVSCGKDVIPQFNSNMIGPPRDSSKNFFWTLAGIAAVKKEEMIPASRQQLPYVDIMLKSYTLFGANGNAASWNDLGVFFNALNKDRDVVKRVDDAELKRILSLTGDTLAKIKALYSYLQQNFRYVNVALGIGGWQPQEASFTLKEKYGDCKALAIVMKALLKKAGIQSYPCMVCAGNETFDLHTDFPYPGFNHVILCVPYARDTVWLECTSNTAPFNYLGQFTANRKALLVFDGGARLIKTPAYNEIVSQRKTASHIKLTGEATSITAQVKLTGTQQETLRMMLDKNEESMLKQTIGLTLNLKNTLINNFHFEKPDADAPVITLSLELSNEGTIRKTESRLFVKTNIFNPIASVPEKNEHRKQPIVINTGYAQTDTIVYSLPAGYAPESFKSGEGSQFTDQFGSAGFTITFNDQSSELTVIRNFCLKQATYPANQYQPLREFLLKSQKQCCPELVLKKQG